MSRSLNILITTQDNADNTTEKTFVINVKTSIASMNNLITLYNKNRKLGGSIVAQLTNDLKQAQHQLDKGSNEQAIKFMKDVIKHLNNSGLTKEIDTAAKKVLISDAESLIKLWQK